MMRQVALGLPRRLTESRTASRYCVSDKPAPTRLALLTFPVARIDEIRALSLSGRTLVPPRTCALHKSPYLLWFAASASSVPPASPLSAAVHAYRVPGARRVSACGWRCILRSCARADLRIQSRASFDGNRLTGLKLSKRIVKIGLTTIYLEGRETLSASRMRCCCWSGMGNLVTAILSSTL